MQKMILVPVEQYSRMIESNNNAAKELQEVREQFKAAVIQKEIKKALYNKINDDDREVLSAIENKRYGITVAICVAFRYGVMRGKRAERDRKKKSERFKQNSDVTQELKLYDYMDKHNCDRDVAELLLRDQEEDRSNA
ncbi:hypothetical protein [Lacrimispora sp.]|uniref:hypothetical protein n=1 Tax=Lacrimispora sp. TaxID=2719234 RepID=UPI0028B1CA5D|nr:hypothetical protein [Lacrimispora sp.]